MRVIFAGGASGGHLYPALAIAEKLKKRDSEMEALFVTSKWEISSEIIETSGYTKRGIDAMGFDRKNLLNNIPAIKAFALSSMQIKRILSDFNPDVVIGTGGNVCGSVVRIASKRGIPTFLQEQNVLPGLANRLAEKYANKIFVAFEESKEHFKDKEKLIVAGNPVRDEIIHEGSKSITREDLINKKKMTLLIFGGSQGADKINDIGAEYLISIKDREDVEVFFITGHRRYDDIVKTLTDEGALNSRIHVMDYIENIHEIFAKSDIIISRSGALSVSEIAVIGKPSILIPSPNVSGNHQYYNAKTLADKEAAIIIEEKNLSAKALEEEVDSLWEDKEKLFDMSNKAKSLGRPDSAEVIAENIFDTITVK